MDWFYYIWKNIEDGELFCVQEHDLDSANEIAAKELENFDDWDLIDEFLSDDAGDAYVDALGLDVF